MNLGGGTRPDRGQRLCPGPTAWQLPARAPQLTLYLVATDWKLPHAAQARGKGVPFPPVFNLTPEALANAMSQEKETNALQLRKEDLTPPQSTDAENPRMDKEFLELITDFSKAAGDKANREKSVSFPRTSSKQVKFGIKNPAAYVLDVVPTVCDLQEEPVTEGRLSVVQTPVLRYVICRL